MDFLLQTDYQLEELMSMHFVRGQRYSYVQFIYISIM